MKEKIIKILEEKAKCLANMHADFDNVDWQPDTPTSAT